MQRLPRLHTRFADHAITETYAMEDGSTQEITRTCQKLLPHFAFGDTQNYEHCILYSDTRHEDRGQYQATLFLLFDHLQRPVNYFVNEIGHGSGFHGGWYPLGCFHTRAHNDVVVDSKYVFHLHIKFDCLGSRGKFRNLVLRGEYSIPLDFIMTPFMQKIDLISVDDEHRRYVQGNTVVIIKN